MCARGLEAVRAILTNTHAHTHTHTRARTHTHTHVPPSHTHPEAHFEWEKHSKGNPIYSGLFKQADHCLIRIA